MGSYCSECISLLHVLVDVVVVGVVVVVVVAAAAAAAAAVLWLRSQEAVRSEPGKADGVFDQHVATQSVVEAAVVVGMSPQGRA